MHTEEKKLQFDTPVIMGILNVTPDSFYTGGQAWDCEAILQKAENMLADGASILDIGGMSTRPGAVEISVQEEIDRVVPIVEQLQAAFPKALLSVDTYRSKVAESAIQAGAGMINDISGAQFDIDMLPLIARCQLPYICMHVVGDAQTMHQHQIQENIMEVVTQYFIKKIEELKAAGIHNVILDPGFGFGKTMAQNYAILNHLSSFLSLQKPLLVALSRKSMIYKPLGIDVAHALNGTTALHMVALQNGAKLLRVHDVKEAAECIQLYQNLQSE
jgi:dihydropteroate synthase